MRYAFCEPVQNLLAFTPIHVRALADGQEPNLGGYSSQAKPVPVTLCGRVPYYGWDLEGEVTEESIARTLEAEVHPTCPRCAQKWRELQPGYVAPPPPKFQGVRTTTMAIIDEASDVGF